MSRSLPAVLLACACATAMSAAAAREVEHLSAGDSGGCPAEVAAAKAEATDEHEDKQALVRSAKPATAPVRSKPTVRGADATPGGGRLQAPRWHSFLPGMFR